MNNDNLGLDESATKGWIDRTLSNDRLDFHSRRFCDETFVWLTQDAGTDCARCLR